MYPDLFDTLVEVLGNILVINEGKSYARSEAAGPIIPEIRLHCLMRYLAGGSYLDVCTLLSIPHPIFYYILWKTCDRLLLGYVGSRSTHCKGGAVKELFFKKQKKRNY
jgi:hypothetical protein